MRMLHAQRCVACVVIGRRYRLPCRQCLLQMMPLSARSGREECNLELSKTGLMSMLRFRIDCCVILTQAVSKGDGRLQRM